LEQWEYWTGFVRAEIDSPGVQDYLKQRWPNWDPPKYAPQAMIPELNKFGAEGWEMVHMEPVREVGKNHDISFFQSGMSASYEWSHVYFCVFKRKK
jgi:hypothetical protein